MLGMFNEIMEDLEKKRDNMLSFFIFSCSFKISWEREVFEHASLREKDSTVRRLDNQ